MFPPMIFIFSHTYNTSAPQERDSMVKVQTAARKQMLYDILHLKGNKGTLPPEFVMDVSM